MTKEQIVEEIRKLAPDERVELAHRILDESSDEDGDADDELSDEQRAELLRRIEEHRKDPSSGISWEQVQKDLEQCVQEVRARRK